MATGFLLSKTKASWLFLPSHFAHSKALQLFADLQVVPNHGEDVHGPCGAAQGHAALGELVDVDDLGDQNVVKSGDLVNLVR